MEQTTDLETGHLDAPLAALVAEHSAAVYRLARSVVRDPGLSDDVTQETFIKVWKHRDEFRGDGSMRGWILRIAHREAIAVLRRQRDTPTEHSALGQHSALGHRADQITVARLVEGRAALEGFREALDTLDELSRAILVLREVEGLAYEEIAATVDVSVATVKSRLLRARRSMAISLEGWRS